MKYGYDIQTYYRFADTQRKQAQVFNESNQVLLELSYGDTAKIWRINQGLKRSQEQREFAIDRTTGEWLGSKKDQDARDPNHIDREVYLQVADTSNVLIIEPKFLPQGNPEEFIVTFQQAIAQAIQAVYTLEPGELSTERLGNGRTIMLWESAEGGAGVLSQMLENPKSFQAIANIALEICHFIKPKDSCI
jgi:hypothetical protein